MMTVFVFPKNNKLLKRVISNSLIIPTQRRINRMEIAGVIIKLNMKNPVSNRLNRLNTLPSIKICMV